MSAPIGSSRVAGGPTPTECEILGVPCKGAHVNPLMAPKGLLVCLQWGIVMKRHNSLREQRN